jgi:hypothetical protein
MMLPPLCFHCIHNYYRYPSPQAEGFCAAFPEGPPKIILSGVPGNHPNICPNIYRIDHIKPYPGDHGIQFEPVSYELWKEAIIREFGKLGGSSTKFTEEDYNSNLEHRLKIAGYKKKLPWKKK